MSQFGKNPPWARDAGPIGQAGSLALNQSQLGLVSQVYSQSSVPAPTVFSLQPGIALPTTLASSHMAAVSYPSPRPNVSAVQQKQRVFTGAVTKLHENFGFVDEDVFFQMSCVKGPQPKLGDRVLVEASYNANMPFKWNATRIQVLTSLMQPGNPPPASQTYQGLVAQPTYHSIAPVSQAGTQFHGANFKANTVGSSVVPNLLQSPPPLMSKQTQQVPGRGMNAASSSRRMDMGAFRDRADRLRDGTSSRERRELQPPRKRSKSPCRSRSPQRSKSPRSPSLRTAKSPLRQRRPVRAASRYTVQIPKISLDLKEANLMTLRSRYANMYIPSDFFNAAFVWVDIFPMHRPLGLGNSCDFHIMPKSVEPLTKSEALLDPSDADYKFSVKVMLLTCPTLEDLYHRSCALAEDPQEVRESFQHPTRLIQFLVGLKGKSEPMAIGGAWSPSLDGRNPEDDPRVLINTAVRTTKALTGIDLSCCTQWYRFMEIRYFRVEEVRKGRTVPSHVETVVIFLPDVWTCCPTRLEWHTLAAEYKRRLDAKLSTEEFKPEPKEEEAETEKETADDKKDPTHHSELDPKTMKLTDLRQELECRNLSSKGLKSQLIARLTKALRSEEEKEAEETENRIAKEEENKEDDESGKMDADDKDEGGKKMEEEERKRRKERERMALICQYTLPDKPSILVHPSATAKGGKFECSVMSLSLLLDYRPEDNKEHVFEVSLFAETFNEMLMRDFGFQIYKFLVSAKDSTEDEKKDKQKEDECKNKSRSKDSEKKERNKVQDGDVLKKDVEEIEKKCGNAQDADKQGEMEAVKGKNEQKEDVKKDDCKETLQETKGEEDCRKTKNQELVGEKLVSDSKPEMEKVRVETKESAASGKAKVELISSADKMSAVKDENIEVDLRKTNEGVNDDDGTKDVKERKSLRSMTKHDQVRVVTSEPDLLLAFVYFDQSHAGYLVDKDVEEILFTLGLQLSRAQVKKLVSKLASRDMLNYRKLTDTAADKEEEEKIGATETDEGTDRMLSLGNRRFFNAAEVETGLVPGMQCKRIRLDADVGSDSAAASSDGFVMHNGALVDINSVQQNLSKSEKSRVCLESKLKELQRELDDVRMNYGSLELNSQMMSSEIQELRKKLREQRRSLDQTDASSKQYRDLLMRTRSSLSTLAADIKDAVVVPDKDSKTVKSDPTD